MTKAGSLLGEGASLIAALLSAGCGADTGTTDVVGQATEGISCEMCYGAAGSGCDPRLGASQDSSGKYWTVWVSMGSEAHDTCCHFHSNGHECGGTTDDGNCSNEWNAAVGDWANGTQFQRHQSNQCWGGNFDLAGIVHAADGNWVIRPHSGAIYPRLNTAYSVWWDHDVGGASGASCSTGGGVWCQNGWTDNCGIVSGTSSHSCVAQFPDEGAVAVVHGGMRGSALVARDVVDHMSGLWGGNDSLWDPSGCHELRMQQDGNLVLYSYCAGGGRATWSTRTSGTDAAVVYVQDDGNVVLYDSYGQYAYWSTGTAHNWTNTELTLQDDGNLVVYRLNDGAALWSSHTNGK